MRNKIDSLGKKRFLVLWGMLLCVLSVLQAQAHYAFSVIDAAQGLSDNRVRYILQLRDGRMVVTTDGGLNLYDGTSFSYLHREDTHVYPLKAYVGSYHEYLYEDSLLFIKDYKSLMLVNLRRESYEVRTDVFFRQIGLESPVLDLFVDKAQNLWLLTEEKELFLRKSGEKQASKFLSSVSLPAGGQDPLYDLLVLQSRLYLFFRSGLMVCYEMGSGKEVYRQDAFSEEKDRNLYGATSLVLPVEKGFYQLRNGPSHGIFLFFNLSTRKWETIVETNYPLNALAIGREEQVIWVAHQQGLLSWDSQKRILHHLPVLRLVDGHRIHTVLTTLFNDSQGGLWIGTLNQGMLYYHPDRFKIRNIGRALFPDSPEGNLQVERLAEGPGGIIYLQCNQSRYYAYDKPRSIIERCPFTVEIKKAFERGEPSLDYRGKRHVALLTDRSGRVWGGTSDGLKLWESSSSQARTFYTDDGLVNNSVRALLEDRNHNVWASTSNGLSRITVLSDGTLHFRNFDRLDGVLEGEFGARSALAASDGTLYFGGLDGFNQVDLEQLTKDTAVLTPLFVSLYLYGERVKQGDRYGGNVILEQAPSYTRKLLFDYDQNFFTLCFSALNYVNPSQTIYRFRLVGVDDGWREERSPDGLLRANYTNLSPGTYRFAVCAVSGGGNWKEAPYTEIEIRVKAPFWATPWAYTLYGVLFFSLLGISVYGYVRFKKQRLERHYKEEILLLRMKNLLEECDRYQELLKQETTLSRNQETDPAKESNAGSTQPAAGSLEENGSHNELLSRVVELIEQNLHNHNYSVEQLSRDLCMDRTGLYRKLTALVDKSPTLLIRSIRLKRAAQLLAEQDLPVAEVAFRVGFSSPAYLSKCFQEEYGMKPSKYAKCKRRE